MSYAVGDMWRVNKAPHSTSFFVNRRKLKIQSLMKIWVSCGVICFAFFVLKAGDEMFLFFYFPMQRQHLMKTYVVQGGQVKQGSVSEYPKIPKISPSMYKPLQI